MLFTNRAVRILYEAVEEAGFKREDVTRPLGFEPDELLTGKRRIEWPLLAALGVELFNLFGRDDERLREMGRRIVWTQSLGPFRDVARSVVSLRALYEFGMKWFFPAIVPHLSMSVRFVTPTRAIIRFEIPEPLDHNPAFFPVAEGAIAAMPQLLGHPPAIIVERAVTVRTCEFVLEFHGQPSLLARARKTIDGIVRAPKTFATLEEQRNELAENIRALQVARDELRMVLDRLPDFVAIHSDGTILWVNRALVTGLGYMDASEIVGRKILDTVAPTSQPKASASLRPDSATTGAALSEWILRSKTGQDVTVELAPSQSVVFDGFPAKLLVARDVTERVRMQQKLIVADRLASVGLLAAGVAHEVNNPLGYVLNNIELARKEDGGSAESAERRRQVLSTALEGVDRIRVIVRDLLMLSRGDDGPLGPIDVGAVAASTLALAAPEIERTTRLVRDFAPAPMVVASSARVSQVLLNLVGNALEAMNGRPVERNQLVVRTSRTTDGRVALEVSDTGTGITEHDLSRVFEPFFTTKAAGRGTGLGLAIAQKIVVEMGGEIAVESTLGCGTTFRVLLPAAPQTMTPLEVPVVSAEQTQP
jgi:PAS domain S-box-containing protein